RFASFVSQLVAVLVAVVVVPVDALEHRLVDVAGNLVADLIRVLARETEVDAGEDAGVVHLGNRVGEAREASLDARHPGGRDGELRVVTEHRSEYRRGRGAHA